VVFEYAQKEYEIGKYVVVGGDWNYEFTRPGRPTTTSEEFLFWIHLFPYKELPTGWHVAIGQRIPSVRTNERPYIKNENFTTVIDGFISNEELKLKNRLKRLIYSSSLKSVGFISVVNLVRDQTNDEEYRRIDVFAIRDFSPQNS